MASLLDNINTLISGILTNAVYPATDMNPLLTQVVTLANPSYQAVVMTEGGDSQLSENTGVAKLSGVSTTYTLKLAENQYVGKRVRLFFIAACADFNLLNSDDGSVFGDSVTAVTTLEFICTNATTNSWELILSSIVP